MCPLRFILVFFSAILAGYLAWKTVSPSHDEADFTVPPPEDPIQENNSRIERHKEIPLFVMMQNGFLVFIDMASGRYLWKNIRQFMNDSPTS